MTNLIALCRTVSKWESKVFDVVPKPTEAWTAAVRYAESEGYAIAALTKGMPQGVFCATVKSDAMLAGWGTDGQTPTSIRITHVGVPLRSYAPEPPQLSAPGLKFVPQHNMGLIVHDGKTHSPVMWIPSSTMGLHPTDTGAVQYAQGCFEGGSARPTATGTATVFRADALAQRFVSSCEAVCIPPLEPAITQQAILDLATYNKCYIPNHGEGQLYLRPSAWGMRGGLGVKPATTYAYTFEGVAFADVFPESITLRADVNLHRPWLGGRKVAGNYAQMFAPKATAKAAGYNDVLCLSQSGMVEELSVSGIAFLEVRVGDEDELASDATTNKKKPFVWVFPPVSGEAPDARSLPSITRDSAIHLLRAMGETVEVRDVHYTELTYMAGAFGMGNAVGLMPIRAIDVYNGGVKIIEMEYVNTAVTKKIAWLKTKLQAAQRGGGALPAAAQTLANGWVTLIG